MALKTRHDVYCGLFENDFKRFEAIRTMLEERTGRPHSGTKVVEFLLDRNEELVRRELHAQHSNGQKKGK